MPSSGEKVIDHAVNWIGVFHLDDFCPPDASGGLDHRDGKSADDNVIRISTPSGLNQSRTEITRLCKSVFADTPPCWPA
jgi:hypothetical protein